MTPERLQCQRVARAVADLIEGITGHEPGPAGRSPRVRELIDQLTTAIYAALPKEEA